MEDDDDDGWRRMKVVMTGDALRSML